MMLELSTIEKFNLLREIINNRLKTDISIPRRDVSIIDARKIFYFLGRKHTKSTFSELGKFLNQNHTTVLHAIKSCENLMCTDKHFRLNIERIEYDFVNSNKSDYQLFQEAREKRIYWQGQESLFEQKIKGSEMIIS